MKNSSDYYTHICKNCGNDCDDIFCSWICRDEWESGKADYDYEVYRDKQLEERK